MSNFELFVVANLVVIWLMLFFIAHRLDRLRKDI